LTGTTLGSTSSLPSSDSSLCLLRGAERGEELLEVFSFASVFGLRMVVAFSVNVNLFSFPLDVGTRTSSLTISFFDLKSPSVIVVAAADAAAVEERVTRVEGIVNIPVVDTIDASVDASESYI